MAVLAFLQPLAAVAKVSPDYEWESVRTPHFRVHYPPSYRLFASHLTAYLEEAYQVLSQDLHWDLHEPAEVVVRGDSDIPNGLSEAFPLNRLIVNAVPFSPAGSIAEYDDWIRTIAYHELTHLISNDTTRGIFSLGRTIFGATAKMNPYQPLWLEEGLAVFEETARSPYGRGRSVFDDMVLRAAVRDGLLESGNPLLGITIDRLNDGIPYWPGGLTPYIYGYVMQELVADAAGPAAPGQVSFANGGRLPFLINQTVETVANQDYYALWERAITRLHRIADQDLATIRKYPVTSVKPFSAYGRSTQGLAFSEDGARAFFIRDSYRTGPGLAEVDLSSGHVRELSYWRYGGGTQLRYKGGRILYSRNDLVDEFKLWSDVYLWDPDRGDEYRLTEGARAVDPDFSPEFAWDPNRGITDGAIVYVKNLDDGNQALVTWNGSRETVLYRGKNFERIASPAWGRGAAAEWIVFALKANGEGERLMAAFARDGSLRALTPGKPALRHNEMTPSWTPRGTILYASTETGAYDIYETAWPQANGEPAQPVRRTRLETGALYPVESPSGKLFAMAYGGRGYDLAALEGGWGVTSPALQPLHEKITSHPIELAPGGGLRSDGAFPELKGDGYSPFPAILPHYWSPYVLKVADGWNLGIQTSGTDALDRHQYSLLLAWDSRASFPVYDALYRYDGLYPTVEARRTQENRYLGVYQSSNVVDTTGLTFTYPIGFWNVSFGGTVTQSNLFNRSASSGGVQARFSHGVVNTYPDSIDSTGEAGHRADVTFNGFFVGPEQFWSGQARLEGRIPSFWTQHFFRLYASGAHASNQDLSAYYYAGGGESNISGFEDLLVRGYPTGELLGRDIAVANLEYWMPIKDLFRGRGTMPAFYERAKLKLFADTGSAEYVNGASSSFGAWPVGVGAQILQDVKVLYRIPFTIAVGLDWGLNPSLGGQVQVVMGVFTRL